MKKGSFISNVKAFTLVELLVVVSIIALLLSILLPSLSKARSQAKKTVCLSNLRQQGIAMGSYVCDSKGKYPHGLQPGFWPFGALYWTETGTETPPIYPAGQGALIAGGFIKDLKFFYCPALQRDAYVGYDRMVTFQPIYEKTHNLKDIDYVKLYTSYCYWVGYRTGIPAHDKNLALSVADSQMSRPDKILITDVICTNATSATRSGNYSQAYKRPDLLFANHKENAIMQGGSLLYNDGSVKWADFKNMQDNWGTSSPLKYNRVRFIDYTSRIWWF